MDLKEFDALLHDAEVKLKRLKSLYEQWFQGIERIEPTVARKDLDRLFALLAKEKPRNTAARFRLQQLSARYSIYLTYWGRIARQIEEGTYERDVRRAMQQRVASGLRPTAKTYELDLDESIEDVELAPDDDEIAAVLRELEKPRPAPTTVKPVLSAFSPFANVAKKPKPPMPPLPALKKTGAPSVGKADARSESATQKAPSSTTGTREPVAARPAMPEPPSERAPVKSTFKKPAVATFGKPKPNPAPEPSDDATMRQLDERHVDARKRNNGER